MASTGKIQWVLVVGVGFLIEVALIIALVPVLLFIGSPIMVVVAPIACFGIAYLVTRWFRPRIKARFTLHGLLIGIVATVIYIALLLPQGISAVVELYGASLFILGNGLRIAGAVVGASARAPQMQEGRLSA